MICLCLATRCTDDPVVGKIDDILQHLTLYLIAMQLHAKYLTFIHCHHQECVDAIHTRTPSINDIVKRLGLLKRIAHPIR